MCCQSRCTRGLSLLKRTRQQHLSSRSLNFFRAASILARIGTYGSNQPLDRLKSSASGSNCFSSKRISVFRTFHSVIGTPGCAILRGFKLKICKAGSTQISLEQSLGDRLIGKHLIIWTRNFKSKLGEDAYSIHRCEIGHGLSDGNSQSLFWRIHTAVYPHLIQQSCAFRSKTGRCSHPHLK
jgi:hypothetical protein